jgi:hypothetical protein
MSAGWKIEPKDVTAILALILSVVTFWRTARIDKRNREIAAEQKEQENKQEALAAIGEFEKKRQELRLEIVSILIAAERRVRDLSVLLKKAKTPQVQQIISSELDGLRSLIKETREAENKAISLSSTPSAQHSIELEKILGGAKSLHLRLPLDADTHEKFGSRIEDALAQGG